MSDDEMRLPASGGARVVRIGDTVRRPARPWSRSVQALLKHLQDAGFNGAPGPLGFDSEGREVVAFVAGADGRIASCYDDSNLVAVAAMIRRFHDAVVDFNPPSDFIWRPSPNAPPGPILCHSDLSPANTVYFDGRPRAFVDWDMATPSTRMWDLSYAARTFVPLYPDDVCRQFGYSVEPVAGDSAYSVTRTAWIDAMRSCRRYNTDSRLRRHRSLSVAAGIWPTNGPIGSRPCDRSRDPCAYEYRSHGIRCVRRDCARLRYPSGHSA